jgi:peptide/nickel transport system permease protein
MRAAAFITNPNQLNALPAIIRKYGLDQPVYVQYWNWLREVFHGNLGWSQTARLPVRDAIGAFFPATFELTLYAFVPIMIIGVWLGTAAAVHRDRIIDHISRVFSVSFRSLPSFVWGLLILMILYGRMNWFPPGRLSLDADLFVRSEEFRTYTGLMTVDALLNGRVWIFFDALRHLMGPVLTLTMVSIALLVRITRSAMLEVLNQDYIRTARSKGLDEPVVIDVHARRNALIPVITLSSLTFVGLLGGVVITETIFNFPNSV